jgi:hypothetical protein
MKYLTEQDIDRFFDDGSDDEVETFKCINCSRDISYLAPGTKNRNHCPFCLFSKHVDKIVGDRKANCNGKMNPIGRFKRPNKEDVIIHQCETCKKTANNRIAGDDDFELFLRLPLVQQ